MLRIVTGGGKSLTRDSGSRGFLDLIGYANRCRDLLDKGFDTMMKWEELRQRRVKLKLLLYSTDMYRQWGNILLICTTSLSMKCYLNPQVMRTTIYSNSREQSTRAEICLTLSTIHSLSSIFFLWQSLWSSLAAVQVDPPLQAVSY